MTSHPARAARVRIASRDPACVAAIRRLLADDVTHMDVMDAERLAASCDPSAPDVLVLDRASLDQFQRRMRVARQRWPTCPIIVLNARDEGECVRLIDEGADDACVSGSAIADARLHAIARRARALNADRRVSVGDIVLDREHRRVWCAGDEVSLSPREYDMLSCLVQHAPAVVGRQTLTEFVWGGSRAPRPNTVEVYVGYLRRKLGRSRDVVIETVRRAGYLLLAQKG